MALVKDIMTTQVLTVKPTTSVKEAIKLIVEIDISGLIVTDDNHEIVGVISGKDLLVAYDMLGNVNAPIDEFINRDVLSITQDTTIEDARKILIQTNVLRLPVVDHKKVIGVVSRGDVLKYILKNYMKSS